MLGGQSMGYRHAHSSSIIRLSGEDGKKIFSSILKSKSGNFDSKKASRKAHKELRKQGFYM